MHLLTFVHEVIDSSFKDDDLSCEAEDRSRRPRSDFMDGIRRHLEKFLFTSAEAVAKAFRYSALPMSRILKTHSKLQKLSRRKVSHELTDDQNC
jgi:hypothetical protein